MENAHHYLRFQGVNTEHMGQWIRFWPQDQKVWGLIPTASHVQKCPAFFFPHAASAHIPAMDTCWDEKF